MVSNGHEHWGAASMQACARVASAFLKYLTLMMCMGLTHLAILLTPHWTIDLGTLLTSSASRVTAPASKETCTELPQGWCSGIFSSYTSESADAQPSSARLCIAGQKLYR